MDLDGLALDKDGLEGLYAKPVESGGAVEEDGVFPDDFFQVIPDLGTFRFVPFAGDLDARDRALPFPAC